MTHSDNKTRLNKYISHNSKYSRREADEIIKQGTVSVNNKPISELSTKVREDDIVKIGGKIIRPNKNDAYTVIVYNKQKGEIVSKKDPQGRKTVYDCIAKKFNHFITIGRLDYASEGVLLLTDNVDIANELMHSKLERVYKIKIAGKIKEETILAMRNGIILDDAKGAYANSAIVRMNINPFSGWQIQKNTDKFSILKVAISEGKNRELRRFFAHFNTPVMDLKRVDYGGIELNSLPSGKTRYLTKQEYQNLRHFIKQQNQDNE